MSAKLILARRYAAATLRKLVTGVAETKGLRVRIRLIEDGEFDEAGEVQAVLAALGAVEQALGRELGVLPSGAIHG